MHCVDGRRSYAVNDGETVLRRNTHHLRPTNGGHDEDQLVLEPPQLSDEQLASTRDVVPENSSDTNQPVEEPAESRTMNNQQRTTRSGRIVKPLKHEDFDYY